MILKKLNPKIIWSISIAVILITACFIIYYFIDLKTNNRFVSFALVFITGTFAYTWIFLTSQMLRKILLPLIGMFAFTFMLVPLYNVFCDVTGLNGKMDLSITAAIPSGIIQDRIVTVEFVVHHNQDMPWEFKPQHTILKLHPGELAKTAYFAKNPTKSTMTAQAIPSITPSKASKHLKKIECFCFNSQKLGAGESAHLGLQFYLDPDLPKDVQRLTLAYTLFDVSKES
jgi:cytochrome c oxidase assembly protein subunit 11